jgi:hypothetical protein
VRSNWNIAAYVVAAAAFGAFGFGAAFPVAFAFGAAFSALAARIASHLFFDASLMALRPAALSFRFGFSGAAVSFAAAHCFV